MRPHVETWLRAVTVPRRRAAIAAGALVVVASLLLARAGTPRARLVAAFAMLAFGALVIVFRERERRVFSDPRRVIGRVAGRVDPERAGRALRALTLVDEEGDARAGTSNELARLHVERVLASFASDRIAQGAARIAMRWGVAALVLAAGVLVVAITNPWGVVEGADVLVARNGVAPLDMKWLDDLDVRARAPEYLHGEERQESPFAELALPRGTLITFRGVPTHGGRRLLLTDGTSEIPFVEDGKGSVVARWPLAESVTLRVVARFADVVVQEPLGTPVTSIADRAPEVTLEGAPKKILLASPASAPASGAAGSVTPPGDVTEIPIRYQATDDHGLREVHLVLRSATREERRVLARLDGETRFDRGGHVLRTTDPFIKKSHAPVEVRVEAKDNDPITGPKWGASEAITIVPPDVGEPEARRVDALRALRDLLVDTLAGRIAHVAPDGSAGAADRKAFVAELVRSADAIADLVEQTLSASYAGIRFPGRLQALLRGQLQKSRTAVDAEVKAPSATTHAATVKATERFVLVVDAMMHGLGFRDSRDTAKQLADVADDLALGLSQMQRAAAPTGPEADRGTARADAATTVLQGGSRSLMHLGSLGRDLGEIVVADLGRVSRARKEGDLFHGEIAARDLAARLRQPDPSFGSKGHAGRAGGESGGGRGAPGDEADEEGSDAEQAFNEAAQDLERLAEDHAGNMGNMEQALSKATSEEEVRQLKEEAKKHAQAVREATKGLPSVGGGSDSWTSKGAAAREHAEQMARSLEQGNAADAVQSGKDAMQALDEAKRTAGHERWSAFSRDDGDADQSIDDAKKKLDPELRWAEQKLDELRKRAAERASGDLRQGGDEEEKMADRAEKLGQKGRDQGLPAPALDSLDAAEKAARDAARALKSGDADRGTQQQREAQRLLDMAKEALGSSENERNGAEGDGSDPLNDHADIPKADAHKGPEDFRRRVIKGLGQPSGGRQQDAVRRYAEGLLR